MSIPPKRSTVAATAASTCAMWRTSQMSPTASGRPRSPPRRDARPSFTPFFDSGGLNLLHAEQTIAGAEAGNDVVCEKPLGPTAEKSYEIWQKGGATGVKPLCAFNYRFVPAVRLPREMIGAGELGEVRHFRG